MSKRAIYLKAHILAMRMDAAQLALQNAEKIDNKTKARAERKIIQGLKKQANQE